MSTLPGRSTSNPGSALSPFALLILLGLTSQHLAEAGPPDPAPATELRCVCLNLIPRINPQRISNVEVIAAGPHCPRVEVIVKLKNEKEVCLDPEAPVIKKIIQKILDSGNKKTKRNTFALKKSPSIQLKDF